ncbi:uncharacterized protein HaLaN_09871, partial [Haematococcus lacustris]
MPPVFKKPLAYDPSAAEKTLQGLANRESRQKHMLAELVCTIMRGKACTGGRVGRNQLTRTNLMQGLADAEGIDVDDDEELESSDVTASPLKSTFSATSSPVAAWVQRKQQLIDSKGPGRYLSDLLLRLSQLMQEHANHEISQLIAEAQAELGVLAQVTVATGWDFVTLRVMQSARVSCASFRLQENTHLREQIEQLSACSPRTDAQTEALLMQYEEDIRSLQARVASTEAKVATRDAAIAQLQQLMAQQDSASAQIGVSEKLNGKGDWIACNGGTAAQHHSSEVRGKLMELDSELRSKLAKLEHELEQAHATIAAKDSMNGALQAQLRDVTAGRSVHAGAAEGVLAEQVEALKAALHESQLREVTPQAAMTNPEAGDAKLNQQIAALQKQLQETDEQRIRQVQELEAELRSRDAELQKLKGSTGSARTLQAQAKEQAIAAVSGQLEALYVSVDKLQAAREGILADLMSIKQAGSSVACIAPACSPGLGTSCPWLLAASPALASPWLLAASPALAQLQWAPPALPDVLHVQRCIAVPVQPPARLWCWLGFGSLALGLGVLGGLSCLLSVGALAALGWQGSPALAGHAAGSRLDAPGGGVPPLLGASSLQAWLPCHHPASLMVCAPGPAHHLPAGQQHRIRTPHNCSHAHKAHIWWLTWWHQLRQHHRIYAVKRHGWPSGCCWWWVAGSNVSTWFSIHPFAPCVVCSKGCADLRWHEQQRCELTQRGAHSTTRLQQTTIRLR